MFSNPTTKGNKVLYTYNCGPGSTWNETGIAYFKILVHISSLKKSNFGISVLRYTFESRIYHSLLPFI